MRPTDRKCVVESCTGSLSEANESGYCKNHRHKFHNSYEKQIGRPRYFYHRVKVGAKARELEFDLPFEYWRDIRDYGCYYCGAEILCAGMDRIDNDLGYFPGNVLPCCEDCNTLRSDLLTVDETKAVVSLLNKLRGGGKGPVWKKPPKI